MAKDLLDFNSQELYEYFCVNARFMPDAPTNPYFIRVGSTTLISNDTYDLHLRFRRMVWTMKRLRTIRQKGRRNK